ncbi:MAG: S41 family peptidase [Actinomycetota bacterium]|nr:S41 family peptidase [Actinomycetota bacterium]MDD5666669.1 S41 family peptidase [Actinomycetota bacterium]
MDNPTQDLRTRRDRTIIILAVVLSLLLVGACFAVPYLLSSGDSSTDAEAERGAAPAADGKMSELENFLAGEEPYIEAQDIVEQNYVDEVGEEELLYAGARGIRRMAKEGAEDEALVDRGITAMIDSLDDPHSSFMSEEELEALDTQLSGRLTGIGVAMETVKNEIRVSMVLDGTPAQEVGLQEGDIVKEVDGRDISGVDINEVVYMIRGPEGTVVRLGIIRPPSSDIIYYDITRREIEIPVIETEMKEGGIGYLRLTDWTQDAATKVSDALAALREGGAKALIIDLRVNPGGYMDPAIQAADLFLRGGTIVTSRGRIAGATREYAAESGVEWDLPVVILVDRGSASSSEIFAAALRENERCILVGETTFGKGSIQKIFRQADGTGVRLTIARYYTPSGASIDDEGIAPDVVVKNPVTGEQDLQLEKAMELALSGM